jgi:ABC-type polysaccharide/polyol phosphate transport system ATPase subunit
MPQASSDMNESISFRNVSKHYRIFAKPGDRIKELLALGQRRYHVDFWALKDVSFDIAKGSTVGIIGNNGAGKSTILKLIAGITQPTAGNIAVQGSIASLIEIGAGFHLDFSGRDNIFMNCSILGIPKQEIPACYERILEFSELHDFIYQPVRVYSAGMYVRLGFAIAISLQPEILLVDDALAVGDRNFQKKCLAKIQEIKERGCTIVMVTHALPNLNAFCNNVIWLEQGQVKMAGAADKIIPLYIQDCDKNEKSSPYKEQWKLHSPINIQGIPGADIRIERVEFLNEEEQESRQFQTTRPLRIRLTFRAATPVRNPLFRIQFFRADGTFIAGSNTYRHDLDLGELSGEGVLELFIPQLNLLYGTYLVSVGIFPDEYLSASYDMAYDYHAMRYSIEVRSERRDGGGWVYQACQWTRIR